MAHEIGMFVTAMIAFACLAILFPKGIRIAPSESSTWLPINGNHALQRPAKRLWRFSLRELLLVVTLVASVIGLIACAMAVDENHGWNRFRLSREIELERQKASPDGK